jgi:hypothetical protein
MCAFVCACVFGARAWTCDICLYARTEALKPGYVAFVSQAVDAVRQANLSDVITVLHGHSGEVRLPEKV